MRVDVAGFVSLFSFAITEKHKSTGCKLGSMHFMDCAHHIKKRAGSLSVPLLVPP